MILNTQKYEKIIGAELIEAKWTKTKLLLIFKKDGQFYRLSLNNINHPLRKFVPGKN